MTTSLKSELRSLLRPWLVCMLLPVPAMFFWNTEDGARAVLWLFFIGCASLVAYAIRRNVARLPAFGGNASQTWRLWMTSIGGALFCAFAVFSLASLLHDRQDAASVFVAFLIIIPSFCVVPLLTLATRGGVSGVVLSLTLVFCMKLLGCVVVVLVYGWSADVQGKTSMPWTEPNLLVWVFWFNSSILCICCYRLGVRRFLTEYHSLSSVPSGLQQS